MYLAVVFVLAVTVAIPALANNLPLCKEQTVQYTAPSGVIQKDQLTLIKVQPPEGRKAEQFTHNEKPSPNGDAAFSYLTRPDFTKPGVKNTIVLVYGKGASSHAWRIDIRDHYNTEVKVQWINDELLFFRVWWGRIVSTDAILHVPSGRYIYFQEANYGSFLEHCK